MLRNSATCNYFHNDFPKIAGLEHGLHFQYQQSRPATNEFDFRKNKYIGLSSWPMLTFPTWDCVRGIGVRANIHLGGGGADRVLPEWIRWGGVVA